MVSKIIIFSQILLDVLGFDSFLEALRESYLLPLSRLLYPEWVEGGLDSHKTFTVKYNMQGDRELNYHFDNAEVTLNVCLGREFSGGDLKFGKMWTVETDTYIHRC